MIEEFQALRAQADALRKRCALLEAAIEFHSDAIFVKDAGGRYLMINAAGACQLGKSVEEVVGKADAELFPPEAARPIIATDREIVVEGATRTYEEVSTAGGRTRAYRVTQGPYRDDRGGVIGVIGVAQDVTAHRSNEAALREAQEFLARLLDHAPALVSVTSRDGRRCLVNRAWEDLWQRPREEVIGRRIEEIFPPELAGRFRARIQHVIETASPLAEEEEVDAPDGRHWLYTVRFPLRDAAGQVEAVGGISLDITEQKRIQATLRRNESLLAEAQRLAQVGSWSWNVASGAVVWSDELYRICGLKPQEKAMTYDRVLDQVHPDDRATVESLIDRAFQDRQPYESCLRLRHRDGTVRVVQSRGQVLFDECGRAVRMYGTAQDITEQRRAEADLEESRRRFRAVFENSLDGILLMDDAGRYVDGNPAMCLLLGYSRDELVQMTVWDVTPAADRGRLPELLGRFVAEGSMGGDYSLLCKGGATRETEYRAVANILPGLHLAVHRDITERRHGERALRRYAGRLKVLSRRVVEIRKEECRHLARELHDEVGQTFTAIGINLKAIKRSCTADGLPHLEECIGIVHEAIQRIRHLSLDLRPSLLDDLGLVAALRWNLDRQAQRVGYRARFLAEPEEIHLDAPLATAAFRVAQEALTNVARHAQARRVWVRLRWGEGSLSLTIRDDGVGFDPQAIRRRGTHGEGLGLLGMRERATLLGGRVAIRSAPGRGTEVRLTVPLTPTDEGAEHGSGPRPDRG